MGLGLDGADRDAEHVGDDAVGLVVEVAQHEHRALPWGQPHQRVGDGEAGRGAVGGIVRTAVSGGDSYELSGTLRRRHQLTCWWYITWRT